MEKALLEILRCPHSRQPLRLLERAELKAVNAAIAAGAVPAHPAGSARTPWSAGLACDDGRFAYPLDDGIPVLLADEAIELATIDSLRGPATTIDGP